MLERTSAAYQQLRTAARAIGRGGVVPYLVDPAAHLLLRGTVPLGRRVVELRELHRLSAFATPSLNSRGRVEAEQPCDFRTAFVRDRDRIIYSDAFMLLRDKTQVFSADAVDLTENQRIHNRLFHVLKVAQVARAISRALRLNEDLAEAIALGHDLGHTPFGHEGERTISALSKQHGGAQFKHNRQSLRIVDVVEGLNLSFEVRDGIVRHDGERKDPILRPSTDFNLGDREFPVTLEGCVVRLADRLAYLPTDLEDALFLGIITREQIPEIVKRNLGEIAAEIIDTLVRDVIASSYGHNYVTLSEKSRQALDALFKFNYKHVYFGKLKQGYVERVEKCLTAIFNRYVEAEGKTPQEAIDLITGMTDQEAMRMFESF